jgi:hypothetical protein
LGADPIVPEAPLNRSLLRTLLGVLLALVVVPFAAAPAHADGTYTITGTITGTDAAGHVVPLTDIAVRADDYASGGSDYAATYTNADGTYQLTAADGVTAAGPWEIEASCDSGYACYDSYGDTYAPTSYGPNGSPTQVPLTSGTPATVDIEIQRWGTIEGTITDHAGQPVTIPLDWSGLYDGAGETTYTATGPDAQGHYTISHVRPGTDIGFYLGDPSKTYSQYGISPFTVAQGPAVTTQDITLDPYSSLTETVTDTSGTPLPHMVWNVWEQQSDGTWLDQEYGPRPLDAQGSYTLATQIGHHYKICAYDSDYTGDYQPSVRYRTTCWPDATSEADAEVWTPTLAAPTFHATVAMPVAGKSLVPADPWVSGSPDVGSTLTADPGVWGPGDVALHYQWAYLDESGLGASDFQFFKPIAGATSATYVPTADLAGKLLEVEITGTESGYADATVTAEAGDVGATRPSLSTPLTITGSTAVGSTLTASYGWSDTSANAWHTLSWAVDGVTQPGDAETLTITPAMAGKTISARLSIGDYPTYASQLQTSAAVVADGATAGTVAVTGTPAVGQTLTATTSSWRPSDLTLSYQWYADGAAIDGATGATLELTGAQSGHAITVTATGSRSGSTVTATSDPTATVAAAAMTAGTVTITGTPTVGQTLTAHPGTWSPATATLAYQWYADSTAIDGATDPTLVLTTDQAGKAITVKVAGTATGYTSAIATSDPTASVAAAVMTAGTVTITGTPTVGQTLTAHPGAWAPSSATLAYQWYADDTAIDGATDPTLVLTADQAGTTITVEVTGTATGYTSPDATSDPTAAVQAATTTPPTDGGGTTTPPTGGTTPPPAVQTLAPVKATLSGTARVGKGLKATLANLPAGARVSYQWYRNGKAIKRATKASYKLTAKDQGKRITVRATVTVSGKATTSTSTATKVKAAKAGRKSARRGKSRRRH